MTNQELIQILVSRGWVSPDEFQNQTIAQVLSRRGVFTRPVNDHASADEIFQILRQQGAL